MPGVLQCGGGRETVAENEFLRIREEDGDWRDQGGDGLAGGRGYEREDRMEEDRLSQEASVPRHAR